MRAVLVDPAELAQRYASPVDDAETAGPRIAADIVTPLLERLPKREREIVFLYFNKRRRQRDIASLYGITQPAVSARLRRAMRRMRFMASLPSVTEEAMRFDLGELFAERDVEMLVALWRCSCQTSVARAMGVSVSLVHLRVGVCIRRLKQLAEHDEQLEPYARIFGSLREAGAILHEKGAA